MAWRDAIIEAAVGDDADVHSRIEAAQRAVWALRQAALTGEPLDDVYAPAALHQLAVRAPLLQRSRLRRVARRFAEARERMLAEPPDGPGAVSILNALRGELDAAADRLTARARVVRRILRGSALPIAVLTAVVAWWLHQPKPLEVAAIDAVADGVHLAATDTGFAPPDAWTQAALRQAAQVYFGYTSPAEPAEGTPALVVRLTAHNPSYGAVAVPGQVAVEAIRGPAEPFPFERLPVDVGLTAAPSDRLPILRTEQLGPALDVKVTLTQTGGWSAARTWDHVWPRSQLRLDDLVAADARWRTLALTADGRFAPRYVRLRAPTAGLEGFAVTGVPMANCRVPPRVQDRGLWAKVTDVQTLRRVPGATVLWRAPMRLRAAGTDLRGRPVDVEWDGQAGPAVAWYQGVELQQRDPRCPARPEPASPDALRAGPEGRPRMPRMVERLGEVLGVEKPAPLSAKPVIDVDLTLNTAAVEPDGRATAAALLKDRLSAGGALRVSARFAQIAPGPWTIVWHLGPRELGRVAVRLPPRLPKGARFATDGIVRARARFASATKSTPRQ